MAKAPTCSINDRSGASAAARWLPNEGIVRMRVPFGTVVELVTFASDRNGYPWVLIRQPGELDTNYGWTDWRFITCL